MSFLGYRNPADKAIDRARNAVALAEMSRTHSYTADSIAVAESDMTAARRRLAAAEAAKAAWNAKPRGDYERFPEMPETDPIAAAIGFIRSHGHFAVETVEGVIAKSYVRTTADPVAAADGDEWFEETECFPITDGTVNRRAIRNWLGY